MTYYLAPHWIQQWLLLKDKGKTSKQCDDLIRLLILGRDTTLVSSGLVFCFVTFSHREIEQ